MHANPIHLELGRRPSRMIHVLCTRAPRHDGAGQCKGYLPPLSPSRSCCCCCVPCPLPCAPRDGSLPRCCGGSRGAAGIICSGGGAAAVRCSSRGCGRVAACACGGGVLTGCRDSALAVARGGSWAGRVFACGGGAGAGLALSARPACCWGWTCEGDIAVCGGVGVGRCDSPRPVCVGGAVRGAEAVAVGAGALLRALCVTAWY